MDGSLMGWEGGAIVLMDILVGQLSGLLALFKFVFQICYERIGYRVGLGQAT